MPAVSIVEPIPIRDKPSGTSGGATASKTVLRGDHNSHEFVEETLHPVSVDYTNVLRLELFRDREKLAS
jgi:hypothetical protein